MGRPIFLEGEAGVGKTEIAKVLSSTLGRRLIRLQCYEGLDVAAAVYEWNYAAQMIAIRVAEAEGEHDRGRLEHDVFSERFLIKRPLLQALEPDAAGAPVLLIDEIDRTDEAFEAFLLEVLGDFQITIPEMGTVKAAHPPIVVITSNRTREVHDALKRRCLYHWVGYPNAERELAIVRTKVPGVGKKLSEQVVGFVQALRKQDLFKSPGVAETLDWAGALVRARRGRARSRDGLRHARRAAEIPGRHRAARRHQGQGAARRGEVGTARGGVGALSFSRRPYLLRSLHDWRAAVGERERRRERRDDAGAPRQRGRDRVEPGPDRGACGILQIEHNRKRGLIGRLRVARREFGDDRLRQRSRQHLREREQRDRGDEQRQRRRRQQDRRMPAPGSRRSTPRSRSRSCAATPASPAAGR